MDELKEQFVTFLNENDRFCKHNGIRIVDVAKGYTRAEVVLEDCHLNALGIAQGGLVFTLADFTLAGASFEQEKIGVSMHCDISYYKQGKPGERLVAVAREENRTRNTASYRVRVYSLPAQAEFVESEARVIASVEGILGLLVPREGQPKTGGA